MNTIANAKNVLGISGMPERGSVAKVGLGSKK